MYSCFYQRALKSLQQLYALMWCACTFNVCTRVYSGIEIVFVRYCYRKW